MKKNTLLTIVIVKKALRPPMQYKVCWELTGRNEKREIGGLVDACGFLGLNAGTILTYDQDEKREKGGLKISVQPVWRWLLRLSKNPKIMVLRVITI